MDTDKIINQFQDPLKVVFVKMIKGINIEITDEFRKYWGVDNLGRWFLIQSINSDETVCIVSQTHEIFDNVKINDLKL